MKTQIYHKHAQTGEWVIKRTVVTPKHIISEDSLSISEYTVLACREFKLVFTESAPSTLIPQSVEYRIKKLEGYAHRWFINHLNIMSSASGIEDSVDYLILANAKKMRRLQRVEGIVS